MDAQLALTLLVLFVLLDLAALRWGAESRDGFQNPRRRYLPVIDPFFAELAGRDRQRRLLAEAARDRLVADALRGSRLDRVGGSSAIARGARIARVAAVRLVSAVVARVGVAMVVAGVRLQQLALGRAATGLGPATY